VTRRAVGRAANRALGSIGSIPARMGTRACGADCCYSAPAHAKHNPRRRFVRESVRARALSFCEPSAETSKGFEFYEEDKTPGHDPQHSAVTARGVVRRSFLKRGWRRGVRADIPR